MEVVEGRRVCRDQRSPGRGKLCVQTRAMSRQPMFKRVQVVYYLSRNGHLEHPHYMEVTHLAHQQLRLKDVMDRLRNLRGQAMPSLYSWSCKRSYKNGYVWNDLAENDAIYPSEGMEYVLKGSELIDGCTDKLHTLQLGNHIQLQDSNLHPKIKLPLASRHQTGLGPDEMVSSSSHRYDDNDEENAQEIEEDYEMKTDSRNSKNNVSHSTCSRGVATDDDEIQEFKQQQKSSMVPSELSLDSNSFSFSSPPSTTSSDTINNNNNNISKRFEDGLPPVVQANEPLLSRNSMLLSLIACGGSASFRKTSPPPPQVVAKPSPARKSNSGGHKVGVKEEMMMMIGCMSENPRFGNMQSEEKEYFSGSIVESVGNPDKGDVHPGLKKSSSHNEERSNAAELGEAAEEESSENDNGVKGKCIPRKKTTGAASKQSRK